jgi:RNA polymerase sigma-70 factor, ECF subfamily
MAQEDDERDVAAVLAGDVDRFAGIVERWQGPLVNLAFRFARDERLAEEMAQEAFLKCFQRLSQWRRDALFSTWLFALAMNVYRSHLRRFRPDLAGDDALQTIAINAPQEGLADEQRRDAIRKAVAHLPPKYRDALVLYHFEEEDVSTTAQILGVPAGTVKARLHRGRELLKEQLKRWL